MRDLYRQGGLLAPLIWALSAVWAVGAAAQPADGPRETVDQSFTTTRANTASGVNYSGVYHAAGDPQGNPPYLRRMIFYPPRGTRYDTSVPDRCSATDAQLVVQGPDACPAGSRLGGGTAEGIFYYPVTHNPVLDHYQHTLDVLNNANEQILLVKSEGYTVTRGQIHSDGSIEFNPPTCFPSPPAGGCKDDYILQLKSSTSVPRYTKTIGDHVRSYVTTPPRCPARGYWQATIRFWWSDGSDDSVATNQPCRPSRPSHRHRH
jgi:hypothetical protein